MTFETFGGFLSFGLWGSSLLSFYFIFIFILGDDDDDDDEGLQACLHAA